MSKELSGRDFEMIMAGVGMAICVSCIFLVLAAFVSSPINWDALSAIATFLAVAVALGWPIYERRANAADKQRESRRIIQTFIGRLDKALEVTWMYANSVFIDSEMDNRDRMISSGSISEAHRQALLEALSNQLHFDDVVGPLLIKTIESVLGFESYTRHMLARYDGAPTEKTRAIIMRAFVTRGDQLANEIQTLGMALIRYGARRMTWEPIDFEDLAALQKPATKQELRKPMRGQ